MTHEPSGKRLGWKCGGYLIGKQEGVWEVARLAFRLLRNAPVDTCYRIARIYSGDPEPAWLAIRKVEGIVPMFLIQGNERLSDAVVMATLDRKSVQLVPIEPEHCPAPSLSLFPPRRPAN